ncbi:hypothetical protein [Isoptericola cucumis]|uniref:Uncharacterized protein n=1 Tax=Isoptericola cucumis TaxID=1776856 RepID=A0ABQ2BDB2_9MICO|nr:hypothetical protein [Isoptericola cucumis]GGI11419.1 hypothetical protein GCM10007368_36100 [Isoptericola cucumis]
MTRRVAGYELSLDEGWLLVPDGLDDVEAWARETADALVPPDARGGGTEHAVAVPGLDEAGEPGADPVEALAARIADVAQSASASGIVALAVAFLVRQPSSGDVDAMLTVVAQAGLSADAFAADLDRLVAESDDPPYVYAQSLDATVPAGDVRGAHLMIGHLDPDLGDGVAHLEERVALGVFPPDSPDMLEVTVIANGVSVFDDMPQAVVDLLAGLTVELEAA